LNLTGIATTTTAYVLILWRWVLDPGMRGQFVAILHRS